MAGMSRDKCGSAVVAGFLKCVANLKPKGIKVIGAMAMVRKTNKLSLAINLITITVRDNISKQSNGCFAIIIKFL